ncbi:MAG: hypothetical protein IPM63_03920 [Acidobacteriota bacterium]|nr:MAG: hypothetical protein IPM63_03920 [Acidobacteriota bacterium]
MEPFIALRHGKPMNIALSAGLLLLAFAFTSPAQTVPPTPTPTPDAEMPVVVSRDDDIEALIRERTRQNSQAETVPQESPDENTPALSLDALSDAEQKKLIFYLDVLTKLEQRAESLRSQLINMIEKQNSVSTKLQQVEYNLRPEVISGYTSLSGSFRPEDLREQRQSELEIEKRNLENLLGQIDTSISSLENNLRRAHQMAESVRTAFEAVLAEALYNDASP